MKIMKYCALILIFLITWNLCFSQSKSMKFDGKVRPYKVHLPPSYDGTKPLPLILVFNAWTHTPDITETHTTLSIKADTSNFIVVYPAGIIGSNKEWNHDDRYSTPNDVGFIKELIDTLIKDYSIDTNMIYAAGMSNGGGMAYRMAYELPFRIAAIAPVAGNLVAANYHPKRPVPVIHFHAKNDGSVAYSTVKPVVDSWKALNANTTGPDTFFVTSGAKGMRWKGDDNNEFIIYLTDIGGHSWPGGKPSFATPSKAISANNLMWEFFKLHTLNNNITTDVNTNVKEELNYNLYQNYPNPFNPVTTIRYNIPKGTNNISSVQLKVYDILGQEITTLVNKNQNPGSYSVKFDASNLTSGIYLYQLRVDGYSSFKKMMVLK